MRENSVVNAKKTDFERILIGSEVMKTPPGTPPCIRMANPPITPLMGASRPPPLWGPPAPPTLAKGGADAGVGQEHPRRHGGGL